MTACSQRNALLHLAFPAVFEATVSRTHKQQTVDAFADEPTERSGDVDRVPPALRRHPEAARGGPWTSTTAASPLPRPGARAGELLLHQEWLAETMDLLRGRSN